MSIVSGPEGLVDCRHSCYIDSAPSKTAANAATEEEAEEMLGADDTLPLASCASSLRVHPDFCVSSAGQTTRLKFALCDIRVILVRSGD